MTSLDHITELPVPFLIGGIGGASIYATHSGLLKGFPSNLAQAYWGPKFDVDLVSLGHIQRCGGSYIGAGDHLSIYNSDCTLVDHTTLLPNNLSPMTFCAFPDFCQDVKAFSSRSLYC